MSFDASLYVERPRIKAMIKALGETQIWAAKRLGYKKPPTFVGKINGAAPMDPLEEKKVESDLLSMMDEEAKEKILADLAAMMEAV